MTTTEPPPIDLGLSELQRGVLEMIRKHLLEAAKRKATGTLTFELNLQDGGVTTKWAGTRYRER